MEPRHRTAALRTTVHHTLSEEALDHVLDGFRELPPHPDVEPARGVMSAEEIHAFTPSARVYRWVCRKVDVPVDRVVDRLLALPV